MGNAKSARKKTGGAAAAPRPARRVPAAAVVTQAQARDWLERVGNIETALLNIGAGPGAVQQMAQQKDSLAAQLRAVHEELAAALDRAD